MFFRRFRRSLIFTVHENVHNHQIQAMAQRKKQNPATWVANRYTVPVLCERNCDLTKSWYVYFYWKDPSSGVLRKSPFQLKAGINRYFTIKERRERGEALCQYLLEKLKRGWDPVTDSYPHPEALDINYLPLLTLIEAMDFARSKKELAKKSESDYRLLIRELQATVKVLRFETLLIKDVKLRHLKLLMGEMQKLHNASDKKYNKMLSLLKTLFNELVEWEAIEFSPATGLKKKRVTEQIPFKQPETNQKQIIKDYLEMKNPNFLTFVLAIYHTGARPKELLELKVKDVNLQSRMITFSSGITKTGKAKRLPITDELLKRLDGFNLHLCNKEDYLFGSPYHPGEGFRGKANQIGFCPNSTRTKRDTATKLWNKLVKQELEIDADMYGMKHRGGNDKINADISLDAIQALYGHSTKEMTKRYAFESNELFLKQIRDQSPDF